MIIEGLSLMNPSKCCFSVQGVISPGPSIGNLTFLVITLLMNSHPVGYSHKRPRGVTTKNLLSQHWLPLKLKKCYIFGLKKIDELNTVIKCQVFEHKIYTRTVHSRRVMEKRRWYTIGNYCAFQSLNHRLIIFVSLLSLLLSVTHTRPFSWRFFLFSMFRTVKVSRFNSWQQQDIFLISKSSKVTVELTWIPIMGAGFFFSREAKRPHGEAELSIQCGF